MNLTPCEQHRFAVALRAMLRSAQRSREQPSLASLESELSDSASLGYLRRRLGTSRRLANPFIFAKKKKTEHPKGYSVFLAERVVRKLNVASPALDNFEFGEFTPPE